MNYAIGIIGLGVMGANLARNIAGHGFSVVGHDLDFLKRESAPVDTVSTLHDLAPVLEKPRRIVLMVPAGLAVDAVIASLRTGLTICCAGEPDSPRIESLAYSRVEQGRVAVLPYRDYCANPEARRS